MILVSSLNKLERYNHAPSTTNERQNDQDFTAALKKPTMRQKTFLTALSTLSRTVLLCARKARNFSDRIKYERWKMLQVCIHALLGQCFMLFLFLLLAFALYTISQDERTEQFAKSKMG